MSETHQSELSSNNFFINENGLKTNGLFTSSITNNKTEV